jgi:hypothetical protein
MTPLCFSFAVGLSAFGMALSGCGQLWRPFLEASGCADSNTCTDLGSASVDAGPDLTSVPADLSTSPWLVEPSGTTANLNGIWGTDTTSVFSDGGISVGGTTVHTPIWAVGDAGTVLLRASTNQTWSRVGGVGTMVNLYAIAGRSLSDVMVVGDKQTTTAWNGSFWQLTQPMIGSTLALLGVGVSDLPSYLCVGQSNTSFLVKPGTMTAKPAYPYMVVPDLTSTYASVALGVTFVGTSNGDVLRQAGGVYSSFGLPAGKAIRSLWARSASDVWAVGDAGTILHYKDAAV